jgi:hypothetical protein
MKKHVIDQPRTNTGTRLSRYTSLELRERKTGVHPVVEALRRQPRELNDTRLAQEFMKIERQTAP